MAQHLNRTSISNTENNRSHALCQRIGRLGDPQMSRQRGEIISQQAGTVLLSSVLGYDRRRVRSDTAGLGRARFAPQSRSFDRQPVSNILQKIVAHKRNEIEAAERLRPARVLEAQLADAPPVRDFVAALSATAEIALIAEVKKASPSAGLIRERFDPVAIATTYQRHGAACISVLTDEEFFQGHLDDLRAVRQAVAVPLLRKDFLLVRYQVLEAREAGADCVLLIAECLDDRALPDLFHYTTKLGMHALIEIYEPDNLDRVLELHPPLIGVNNRNLTTFVTDLEHSIQLLARVPAETLFVSESGISNRDDVARLQQAGVRAVLVGETLMRADDIGGKVDELLGRRRP
jgi:indole-3-glycerol phosphate synthase